MKKLLTLLLLFCALPLFASEEKKMKAVEMLYQDLKPFIVKLNQDRIVFNYRQICNNQNYNTNDALNDLKKIMNLFYILKKSTAGMMGNGLYAGLDPFTYRDYGGAVECSLLSIITLPKDSLILDTAAIPSFQLPNETKQVLKKNFSCNLFLLINQNGFKRNQDVFEKLVNDKKCIVAFKLFVEKSKISGLFYRYSLSKLFNCDFDKLLRTLVLFDSKIITPENVKFYGKLKAEPIIEKYLKKLSEDNPESKYTHFYLGRFSEWHYRYFYEDFKETYPLLPEEMDGYYRWHEKMFYCH